ncbi:hypothetical protein [Streptomyces sp. NBC_00019]|uniref:hypothetical protein n=1 Tax=Streptomyces sp. NBC_00019 TaxID=2975623 RepID=UPI00324E2014
MRPRAPNSSVGSPDRTASRTRLRYRRWYGAPAKSWCTGCGSALCRTYTPRSSAIPVGPIRPSYGTRSHPAHTPTPTAAHTPTRDAGNANTGSASSSNPGSSIRPCMKSPPTFTTYSQHSAPATRGASTGTSEPAAALRSPRPSRTTAATTHTTGTHSS